MSTGIPYCDKTWNVTAAGRFENPGISSIIRIWNVPNVKKISMKALNQHTN
jgi:hypothetical protein